MDITEAKGWQVTGQTDEMKNVLEQSDQSHTRVRRTEPLMNGCW